MRHETLLLEIGTEELPPKSLLALKTAFAENLKKALDDSDKKRLVDESIEQVIQELEKNQQN